MLLFSRGQRDKSKSRLLVTNQLFCHLNYPTKNIGASRDNQNLVTCLEDRYNNHYTILAYIYCDNSWNRTRFFGSSDQRNEPHLLSCHTYGGLQRLRSVNFTELTVQFFTKKPSRPYILLWEQIDSNYQSTMTTNLQFAYLANECTPIIYIIKNPNFNLSQGFLLVYLFFKLK